MDTGVGFSEILVVVTLVLIFFGSKEIPQLLRTIAKILAKFKYYTDKVKVEIGNVTRSLETPIVAPDTTYLKKVAIRNTFSALRDGLTSEQVSENSKKIADNLKNDQLYKNAKSIMIYANTGNEVETRNIISEMLKSGKRVVLPYRTANAGEIGIAEIFDTQRDIVDVINGVPEPCSDTRKPFFKSDLQLIICSGVAFDTFGARLCREKSDLDRFLKELKGSIPLIGLAFDCQISKETLPFDYRDIQMDQVITESGLLLGHSVG
jgi:5-formyltetrahydrofolate cyclo-ligase